MPVAPEASSAASLLVVARGVTVSFGDRVVLDGVDLDVRAGRPVLVRGPSGCGKTTMLRVLARLQPLTAGAVAIPGVSTTPDAPAHRRRVVYGGQTHALHSGTVREALRRPSRFRASTAPWSEEAARTLLAELGLPDVVDRDVGELSVGQRQRVCHARSLLLGPQVLLLDEPTSALDEASAAQLATVIERWLAGGRRSFVLVTHRASRLASLCRDELWLGSARAEVTRGVDA